VFFWLINPILHAGQFGTQDESLRGSKKHDLAKIRFVKLNVIKEVQYVKCNQ